MPYEMLTPCHCTARPKDGSADNKKRTVHLWSHSGESLWGSVGVRVSPFSRSTLSQLAKAWGKELAWESGYQENVLLDSHACSNAQPLPKAGSELNEQKKKNRSTLSRHFRKQFINPTLLCRRESLVNISPNRPRTFLLADSLVLKKLFQLTMQF